MSDPLGRWFPALDPATGMLTVPLWLAGALAAVLVVFCILAFNRAGREGTVGTLARVSLVLLGASATWFALESMSSQRVDAERFALDARGGELARRAAMPGSALACLDTLSGDVVEGSCEKALFATPGATAAAVSYVSAQLALLSDAAGFIRRGNAAYERSIATLRRAVENDRYGIVAHVLATRDGCTGERCDAFAIMKDSRQVSANIAERKFDSYLRRHAAMWPGGPASSLAQHENSGPAPALTSVPGTTSYAGRPAGPNVFFPSSESIPPVSIMTAEPQAAEPETTGSAATTPPPSPKRASTIPPRRPPQPALPPPAASPAPMDLNAAARAPSTTQ
jgi:hypothetical protein